MLIPLFTLVGTCKSLSFLFSFSLQKLFPNVLLIDCLLTQIILFGDKVILEDPVEEYVIVAETELQSGFCIVSHNITRCLMFFIFFLGNFKL